MNQNVADSLNITNKTCKCTNKLLIQQQQQQQQQYPQQQQQQQQTNSHQKHLCQHQCQHKQQQQQQEQQQQQQHQEEQEQTSTATRTLRSYQLHELDVNYRFNKALMPSLDFGTDTLSSLLPPPPPPPAPLLTASLKCRSSRRSASKIKKQKSQDHNVEDDDDDRHDLHHHHLHHHHHHQHHHHQCINNHNNTKESKHNSHQQQHYCFRHHKSTPSIGDNTGTGSIKSTASLASSTATTKTPSTPITLTRTIKLRSSSASIKRRRNSSYHSYDDLDAVAREKKVISSLKYLCACTGATLRNLSKKTKDLHAKNFCYTKPTWRLWGEEHEKNAIFTVYLKKVRYHRPTPTANNDSDDEISHLEWETVRVRFVKAATLARLVEALATDDGELESTFINVFLSTYRTFATPKDVINLLIRRYDTLHDKHLQEIEDHQHRADVDYDQNASIHEQHKKTLVSALHVWLDGFPEDWNEENLRMILAFASKRLPRSDLHVKVLHRLERILRQQVYGEPNILPWLSSGGGGGGGGGGGCSSAASVLSVGSGGSMFLPQASQQQHYNADMVDQFAGLCLAPAFRGPTHFLQAFRFPHVPVRHFAEQLTRMDSELFKRLIPHQCLGATWARRDKSGSETVVATINQFNAVLFRVISSILIEPRLKPQERALNIATWIDIAQELRLLKNFSSLKAIISGLQSNPIYRLSKIWAVLSKEKMEIFNELARIFSEDNNAWAQREVLMREGTAKFADTVGEHDRHLQKIIQKQSTQTSHGTIPYLGTFLTDLTMIHAAIPDHIGDDGLINFDKKRKEFEVLAQIKLLQGAANTYNLREDPNFDRWFASMMVLDEREAHTLSCQLETPPPVPRKSTASTNTTNNTTTTSSSSLGVCGHRKTDSIASNSSSGAGSQFYCELNSSFSSHYSSRHNSLDRDSQLPNASLMSASSSVSNLSMDSSNSGGQKSNSNHSKMIHSHSTNGIRSVNNKEHTSASGNNLSVGSPVINAQLVQPAGVKNQAPDFYIIRVTYETDNIELDGIVLYKSIMLGNNERTPQVIRNAMMKLGLEADPDSYTLAQVLPDKELVMPRNANVYYAVNTNYNLNFILRPKKDGAS